MNMKKNLLQCLAFGLIALFGLAGQMSAQFVINATGTPFAINFNSYTGAGFQAVPTAGQLSSNNWSVGVMSDAPGTLNFGGTAFGANNDFSRGLLTAGTLASSGGAYARNIGAGDNAFWLQPAGTDFNLGSFVTLRIQNSTGAPMTALDIDYDIYFINDQLRSSLLNFSWSTDNTNWNPVPALDYSTACGAPLSTALQVVSRGIGITGINVADGGFFYVRWTGGDNPGCAQAGNRDEYGLDNITMSIPQAATPTFNFLNATTTVNEGAGTMTATVTLSQTTDCTLAVNLSGTSTATNATDFTYSNPQTIIAVQGGPVSFDVTFPIIDDNAPELTETVVLTLGSITGNCAAGANNTFTGSISPNDLPSLSNLAIVELMYNPAESGTDSTEFLEIYNNNPTSVDLIGSSINLGVVYTFPVSTVVPAGGRVVLCNNLNAFNNRYPGAPGPVFQWTSGALDNAGEPVRFVNAFGQVIDSVNYDDLAPYPTSPNGNGPSLVLCSPTANNLLANNWYAATAQNWGIVNTRTVLANPGAADPGVTCPPTNFGFTPAAGSAAENAGTASYTVTLSSPADCSVDVTLQPSSATLGLDFTFVSPQTVTFTAGGGTAQTLQFNIIDDVLPEATEQVVLTLSNPQGGCSLGAATTFTLTIPQNDIQPVSNLVITEIMYNSPEAGTDTLEFVEIYNANATPVNLLGCYINDAFQYSFPNITMNAGQYLVLCVNANAFQNVYGTPATQWFSGALSNSGEAITLRDGLNNIIDQVTYSNVAPWPTQANGLGRSLVLCSPTADIALASNWFGASTATGDVINNQTLRANPGAADPGVFCFQTPDISFIGTFIDVNETVGTVTLTLQYNGYSNAATSVNIGLNPISTASNGLDFTFTNPTTVTFPAFTVPGTTQTVTIPVLVDALTEGNETIVLNLANATNGATLSNTTYTVTILCSIGSNVIFVNDNAIGANDGSTWNNAFTSLQPALAAATAGDEIWVAQGTYRPTTTLDRNISFVLKADVSIYGSFPDNGGCTLNDRLPFFASVLSGNIGNLGSNADNSYRVITGTNIGSNVNIDRFVIRDGNSNQNGGGLYLLANGAGQTCSPNINDCSICFNNSTLLGGGVGILATNGGVANPSFTMGEIVFNNAANGGAGLAAIGQTGGSATINLGNSVYVGSNNTPRVGGGVALWTNAGGTTTLNANTATLANNTATRNGGGLYAYARQASSAFVSFNNVTVSGNTAANGAGAYLHGQGGAIDATVVGGTVSNNNAPSGIGAGFAAYAEILGGSVAFDAIGTTFSNNNASTGGAVALYALKGASVDNQLLNTRFFNNTAALRGGAVAYSNTTGSMNSVAVNTIATGNTSANGGALSFAASSPVAQTMDWTNASFNGNTASIRGNHAYLTGSSSVSATNSVFWNGPAVSLNQSFALDNTSSFVFNNCLLDVPTCGNIANGTGTATCNNVLYNVDPLFTNAPSDLTLQMGSPAIDAGQAVGLGVDINGTPRPQGNGFDLGAYEYMPVMPRLAIAETTEATAPNLYPNPTTGNFTLAFDRELTGLAQVFDLQGRLVATQALNGTNQVQFDLSTQASGTYMVRVTSGETITTSKVIVHKP